MCDAGEPEAAAQRTVILDGTEGTMLNSIQLEAGAATTASAHDLQKGYSALVASSDVTRLVINSVVPCWRPGRAACPLTNGSLNSPPHMQPKAHLHTEAWHARVKVCPGAVALQHTRHRDGNLQQGQHQAAWIGHTIS